MVDIIKLELNLQTLNETTHTSSNTCCYPGMNNCDAKRGTKCPKFQRDTKIFLRTWWEKTSWLWEPGSPAQNMGKERKVETTSSYTGTVVSVLVGSCLPLLPLWWKWEDDFLLSQPCEEGTKSLTSEDWECLQGGEPAVSPPAGDLNQVWSDVGG